MDLPKGMKSCLTIQLKLNQQLQDNIQALDTLTNPSFEYEDLEAKVHSQLSRLLLLEIKKQTKLYAKHMAKALVTHGETGVRVRV